jgi:2-keto-3-deoxy-6-phosphogluconate aldolase
VTALSRRAARAERTGFPTRRARRAALHEAEVMGAPTGEVQLAEACRHLRAAVHRMGKRRGQSVAASMVAREQADVISQVTAAIERGDRDAPRQ